MAASSPTFRTLPLCLTTFFSWPLHCPVKLRFAPSKFKLPTFRSSLASLSPPPPALHLTMGHRILDSPHLTNLEQKIFNTLKATLAHFSLDTQLRVAGGWVRDKLLGKDCSDIDIALDNMLGREFCEKVNSYLLSLGEESCGVGLIQSNPEQSKHLETARMRMFGMWIDFVNLRAETYAEHSRIPTMEFGTAEQDAYRRDLTINSLFYNINTSMVEDLTGRGISDLKSGIIATPLPPKTTFLDDPLRVLRAVRFGARFGYKLEDDLRKAATEKEVKVALASKVSRERIGHEIDLMLTSHQPVKAIQQLAQLQLFCTVFCFPSELETIIPRDSVRLCVDTLEAVWEVLNNFGAPKLMAEHRRICLLGALLLPLSSFQSYKSKKKEEVPVSTLIIREALKLKVIDAKRVVMLHKSAIDFLGVSELLLSEVENFKSEEKDTNGREDWEISVHSNRLIKAGLLLMEVKELWRAALLLSSVLDNAQIGSSGLSVEEKHLNFMRRSKWCLDLEDTIISLGLENVWERKPLLNGTAIMDELGLKSGGPEVKEWQRRLLRWELAHPTGTADDCREWLREAHAKRRRSS